MAVDFKANQIRVNKIINSGSSSTSPLLIYGLGSATDSEGGFASGHFTTGSDTWLFVSGAAGSKNSSSRGVVTFKGDVVISGSIYNSAGAAYTIGVNNWNELSPSPRLNTTASVAIAGALGSSYAAQNVGSDVFFFVSGTKNDSTATAKKSVFGGDVRISGSFSQGAGTVSSGEFSHAEGDRAASLGNYSHAEGLLTDASADYAHSEGNLTIASGFAAHSEGDTTTASGYAAHSEGYRTLALSSYAHAEGWQTAAVAAASHAGGYGTIASGSYQTVYGKFNKRNNDFSIFVIGDGTGTLDANRGDILRINSGSSIGQGRVEVTGALAATLGITGSLTKLVGGSDYLIAGANITLSTGSLGDVTISAAGGDSYWQSTTPNVIFTTGSAHATFISVSSGMSITGSSIFSGSIMLTGSLHVGENDSSLLYVNSKLASNIIPDGDRTRNLGSSSARFANIYTGDLHLRNDRGDWTIVEEKDFLRVVNNTTGKQYKMVLQPID